MHKPIPLHARFWRRVLVKGGDACWEWQGMRDDLGRGQIGLGGRGEGTMRTHRVAWLLANGPIPDGLVVCHRCDNPPCCRPDHLFLGTQADNVADMTSKGRRRHFSKLSPPEWRALLDDLERGMSQHAAGMKYGVSQPAISAHRKRSQLANRSGS